MFLKKQLIWLIFAVFLLTPTHAQVVFSEIMFDVPGADYNDEFVELFNCSDSAVDLSGWQFSDSTGIDQITDAGEGLILQAGQFAVILDGSYFGHSTTYDSVIPPQALIVTIDDGAFGSNGLSNSQPERLSLIDASGREVAAYRYTIDNAPGYSDEKIDLCAGDEIENWANSLVLGGTPGFRNSVSPADYDIGFPEKGLQITPRSVIRQGQTVQAWLFFANLGRYDFNAPVHFTVFIDLNENGALDALEPLLWDETQNVQLPPGKKDSLSFDFTPEFSGRLQMVARLHSDLDQKAENNTITKSLPVIGDEHSLKINEIKFLTFDKEPEWIELFNAGKETVFLQDWSIADKRDTALIASSDTLGPGGFKVLTGDSALIAFYQLDTSAVLVLPEFPTLNNDQDIVYLLTPWGDWAEQVPYKKSWLWGEENRTPSLERINPLIDARLESNWGPCAARQGATPGKANSLFEPLHYSRLKLNIHPNPFSPDGDGFEDNAIISLQIPAKAAKIRVTVYDILGRKVRDLTDNRFAGQTTQLIWNGRDNRQEKVRVGVYIVFAQILDDTNGIIQEAKTTVTVAR